VTAPTVVTLEAVRSEGKRYLRIVDRQNRRVVTIIELLSPSNKDAGQERENYLTRRNEFFANGVNVVEIDLLRAGRRLPLGDPPPAPSDYLYFVSRAADYPSAGVWPFSLRDPLPDVPVPLAEEDGYVLLPLKPSLERAYDEGPFGEDMDYTQPPVPPLRGPDAAWARELLAARQPPPSQPQGPPS
jgi:hypothetical protein